MEEMIMYHKDQIDNDVKKLDYIDFLKEIYSHFEIRSKNCCNKQEQSKWLSISKDGSVLHQFLLMTRMKNR
jgi:hypothetical protein